MPDTEDSSKYAIDIVVGVVGKAIGMIGGYGTLWLLTDILSEEGYGGYTAAFAVISLLGLFAQMGLRQATIQRVSELSVESEPAIPRHAGAAVSYVAIASIAMTVVALAGTLVLYRIFDPLMIRFIRLLALIIPGMALLAVCDGILRGLEHVSAGIALRQIFVQILRLGGLLIVWTFFQDPTAVVIAIGVSFYVPLIVFGLRTQGWRYLNLSSMSLSHIQFSGYLLANSIASRFLKNTDILLLSILATLSATGSYNVAWKIALVARYIDSILSNTLQPRLSKFLAASEFEKLNSEFDQVRDLTVAGAIPVLIVVFVFGRSLLGLFGNYTGQYNVLLILTVGAVVNGVFGSVGQLLLMGKKGRLILLNTVLNLGGNIFLNILLIPKFGTMGAAVATVTTVYFFTNIVAIFEVKYSLGINTFDAYSFVLTILPLLSIIAFIAGFSISKWIIITLSLSVFCILLIRQRDFLAEQTASLLSGYIY
jgi:O-antigen/teichoic acid export membrane protein